MSKKDQQQQQDQQQPSNAGIDDLSDDFKAPFWPFAIAGGVLIGFGFLGGMALGGGAMRKKGDKAMDYEMRTSAMKMGFRALGISTTIVATAGVVATLTIRSVLGVHSISEFGEWLRYRVPSKSDTTSKMLSPALQGISDVLESRMEALSTKTANSLKNTAFGNWVHSMLGGDPVDDDDNHDQGSS